MPITTNKKGNKSIRFYAYNTTQQQQQMDICPLLNLPYIAHHCGGGEWLALENLPTTTKKTQKMNKQKSRLDKEADEAIALATGTLRTYFANKDINKDENWARLHEKQTSERAKTITVVNKSNNKNSNARTLPPPPPPPSLSKTATKSTSNMDNFEEIEKLARLKDMGIITEEEFQQKKKQLLNL
jgi:hypothetical protein